MCYIIYAPSLSPGSGLRQQVRHYWSYDAQHYGMVYKVRLDRGGTVGIQRTNLHGHATEFIVDSGCIFILSTVLGICGSRDEVVACQSHLPFTNLTFLCASFRRGAQASIKPRSMSQTSI